MVNVNAFTTEKRSEMHLLVLHLFAIPIKEVIYPLSLSLIPNYVRLASGSQLVKYDRCKSAWRHLDVR